MTILLLGLVLFLGLHSIRIVADGWRAAMISRLGEGSWKGLYSLVSLAGFGLVIWGYGLARQAPQFVWQPPVVTRHLAAPLVLVAFVFLAATYMPRNAIKARLRHPMLLGVKTWALAHLISNGALHDIILFGSFLVWAIFCFRAARQRDAAAGTTYPAGTATGTAATVAVGIAAWVLVAFWLHGVLIGVQPLSV